MAIQTDFVGDRGLLYEGQYIRVDRVLCTKAEMAAEAGVYATQEQAAGGGLPHAIEHFSGPFDLHSSANPWEQAYVLLKQRWPEAADV